MGYSHSPLPLTLNNLKAGSALTPSSPARDQPQAPLAAPLHTSPHNLCAPHLEELEGRQRLDPKLPCQGLQVVLGGVKLDKVLWEGFGGKAVGKVLNVATKEGQVGDAGLVITESTDMSFDAAACPSKQGSVSPLPLVIPTLQSTAHGLLPPAHPPSSHAPPLSVLPCPGRGPPKPLFPCKRTTPGYLPTSSSR